MKYGYLNEMCDECAEAAAMGVETSCCGDDHGSEVEVCDMCGMEMQDNVCDCCAASMHNHDQPMKFKFAGVALGERYEFDKFMDDILIRESRKPHFGDSPMRKRALKHQERPINRTRYGVKL